MILTSYFSNYRNFPEGKRTISISRFPPKWAEVDTKAFELAPSQGLLFDYKKGTMTEKEYEERYRKETLSKLDPKEIYKKYNNGIFLCYEKTGDFCHRTIVSKWLIEAGLGLESEELKNGKKIGIIVSKDFTDRAYFNKVIDRLLMNYPKAIIHHDGNKISSEYAKYNDLESIEYNSKWEDNQKDIIDTSDICIHFWNGDKKEKLVNKSKKKIYIVEYKSKKIYTL